MITSLIQVWWVKISDDYWFYFSVFYNQRVIDYNFYFACKRNCRVNFCLNIMRELIKYEDTSEFRAGNLALIALVSACPQMHC